jgi:hypothetical protein
MLADPAAMNVVYPACFQLQYCKDTVSWLATSKVAVESGDATSTACG